MRRTGGAPVLAGCTGVESVNDHGNYQDVKLKGDPQAFLQQLVQKTAVQQFEIRRPSLHDIFVRIAGPAADDMTEQRGAV